MKPGKLFSLAGDTSESRAITRRAAITTGERRPPKKGELYISGAIPRAWIAPNDLLSSYYIAVPVDLVQCPHCGGTGRIAAQPQIRRD